MTQSPPPPAHEKWRHLARRTRPWLAGTTVVVLAAGAVGQLLRDRNLALALMMYIPLAPMGLWAVALDIFSRGRSIPGMRLCLSLAGAAAAVVGAILMIGTKVREPAPPAATEITLLHWTVMWGGNAQSLCPEVATLVVRARRDTSV